MNSCNCASCMLKRPRNNRRIVGETNTHDTPGPPSGVGSMRASSNDSFLFIGDRVCAYMCVCWCGGWGTPWIWNGEISFPKAKATTNNTTDSGHNMTGGVAGWGVGGGGLTSDDLRSSRFTTHLHQQQKKLLLGVYVKTLSAPSSLTEQKRAQSYSLLISQRLTVPCGPRRRHVRVGVGGWEEPMHL